MDKDVDTIYIIGNFIIQQMTTEPPTRPIL